MIKKKKYQAPQVLDLSSDASLALGSCTNGAGGTGTLACSDGPAVNACSSGSAPTQGNCWSGMSAGGCSTGSTGA